MSNAKTVAVRPRRMLFTGLLLLGAAAGACDVDLGTRYVQPQRTFGDVVYTEVCERVAYTGELEQYQAGQRTSIDASGVEYRPMCNFGMAPPMDAPPVMQTVAAEQPLMVTSVNDTAPDPLLDPLNQTLQAMLPAFDGQSGQNMVAGAGNVFLSVAGDATAQASVGRLGWRDGFRPPGTEANAALGIMGISNLYAALNAALPVLWPSSDGAGDAPGQAQQESLFNALNVEITSSTALAAPTDPNRTLALALKFLFTEEPGLRTLPAGQSYFAVLRDARGVAQVNAPGGVLPPQFVDANHDGLPDLDSDGHFLSSAGGSLPDVTPFPLLDTSQVDHAAGRNAAGQALTQAGGTTTLYDYLNLDDTVLAGLLRDTPTLLNPQLDIPLPLSSGIKLLLGPRQQAHVDYPGQPGFVYNGFDTTQAPLLDILYGFVQLLGYSTTGNATGTDMARLLRGAYLLMQNQQSAMARNLTAVAKAFDEAKQPTYAAAQLAETSTLYDDLAPILVRLLRTSGLLSDLLTAMTDPATADLGPLVSIFMTDADYFFMNQNQLDATQPNAVIGSLGKAVNPAAVDSDVDFNNANPQNNRSIMARVLHLVHDANGQQFCNKNNAMPGLLLGTYAACQLLEIDDLAVFYMLTMASQSVKENIPQADFLNAITNSTLQGLMRAGGGLFINNMLGIPGFNFVVTSILPPADAVYPTPQAAARLLFQTNANRSSFQQGSLDLGACDPLRPGTLCCNQNHGWQQLHDGALFALEAVQSSNGRNFYQAIQPIVNAFAQHNECTSYDSNNNCTGTRNAAKILVDLLSVLHRHWPTVQSTFYGLNYEPQLKPDGVSHYEPLIAALLGQGDLWPSTLALAPALLGTIVDDGSNLPVSTLIADVAAWFFDPQAPRLTGTLAFRSGSTTAVRNDGTPTFAPTGDPVIKDVLSPQAQGLVTPYDLLATAYKNKRATLATSPAIMAGWQGAVSNLANIYLLAAPGGPPYKFNDPYINSIELALLGFLQGRVQSHAAASDLISWVQSDLYNSIATSLTGPVGAGLLDVMDQLSASSAAHQQIPVLLSSLVADPGPGMPGSPRFRSVLALTADLLQLLLDDGDVVPLLQKLGPAFDPNTGAAAGAAAVARRSLPDDPNQIMLQLGQNLYTTDSTGLYPAFNLGKIINELNRQNAGQPGVLGSTLTDADYQSIVQTVGQFLADQQRGADRVVNIIQSRNLD